MKIKNFISFMVVMVMLVLASSAQASLIAYYPFEGSAIDATGNGYDGTLNGKNIALTSGYIGQAYAFDGEGDYIGVDLNINPGSLPQVTMGAWVKADTNTQYRQIISHDNGGYDRSLGIDDRGATDSWSAFAGSGSVLGGPSVDVGEWAFVAVAYDQSASSVNLFVDGATYTKTGSLGNGWSSLRIGSNPSFVEYFDGTIDEVFFYDEALTSSALTEIMRNGVLGGAAVPEPATLLLFGTGLVGFAVKRRKT